MSAQDNIRFSRTRPVQRSMSIVLALAVLLLGLVSSQPASATLVNLVISGTMPAYGDVSAIPRFFISPDGRHVVYAADPQTNEAFKLYSAPLSGSSLPVPLSDALCYVCLEEVYIQFDSTGSRVVYSAEKEMYGSDELYSVPIGGGAPTKLSGAFVPGGDVYDFQISPDDTRVVYQADQQTDNVFELYSTPIGGGTVTKLNGALVAGGNVSLWVFRISPDGARVVYHADQDTDEVVELYSVPIGGGTATRLNGALVAGGDVVRSMDSPDGTRVVYQADQQTDEVYELYSVPIGGGVATKLNGALVAGGAVSFFLISPDGARVVYWADQGTDEVLELYSVPIGGGTVTKLNGALVAGGDVSISPDFYGPFSPDGARVVYQADQDTDGVVELYGVPIGGGTVTKLNGALVAGGAVSSYRISPDGARVVYWADQETDEVVELYSVPIGGGTATKLNGGLVAGGDVSAAPRFSPDSTRVVYRADQDTDEVVELYSVPIGGGAATKLNGSLVTGGRIRFWSIGPDSTRVVYQADQETDEVVELYSVPIDGGTVTKLNGELVSGGDVVGDEHYPDFASGFRISPDGWHVVYRADQLVDNRFELFVSFEEIRVYLPIIRK